MKKTSKTMALLLAFALLSTQLVFAAPMPVDIIAGTGSPGSENGMTATFHMPHDIILLPSGEIIVADTYSNLLRRIDINGLTENFAGISGVGTHVDGELSLARLNRPSSLAIGSGGNIFIADSANNSIRVIVGGMLYTFAGGGESGFADGPAGYARFANPSAIAFGVGGYLYVADTQNHVIRRINQDGYATTFAGVPGQSGYANGAANNALFDSPAGVAVAADGRVFVADTGNHVIRVIENGNVRTFAGQAAEEEGGILDGLAAEALFNQPRGLDLWDGSLIIADSANHRIRMVSPDGFVTSIMYADLHFPMGVHVFGDILYIADTGNNMIRAMELVAQVEYPPEPIPIPEPAHDQTPASTF